MKMEDILKECPNCGSTDKTVRRKLIDTHGAHAETAYFKCSECGFEFEGAEDHSEDPKSIYVKELNKKLH